VVPKVKLVAEAETLSVEEDETEAGVATMVSDVKKLDACEIWK
jgi:hypothetical protein